MSKINSISVVLANPGVSPQTLWCVTFNTCHRFTITALDTPLGKEKLMRGVLHLHLSVPLPTASCFSQLSDHCEGRKCCWRKEK